MFGVGDEPTETVHIYVVREAAPKPPLLPIFLSVVALSLLVAVTVLSPSQQPVTRISLRVSAVLLPLRTFTAQEQIMPTGVRFYPALAAHGILTITNGSVISQTLPAGLTFISNSGVSVVTDTAVFVPAGDANGYGVAYVSAHATISGKQGNISPLAINTVEGSSVYIRNITSFHGGIDSYTKPLQLPQDQQTALVKARAALMIESIGLRYPCKEDHYADGTKMVVTWRCQFVTYRIPAYMHVLDVTIQGRNLLLAVWFVERPRRIGVK